MATARLMLARKLVSVLSWRNPGRFVFLDGTGSAMNMIRRYGWGARGERLVNATQSRPLAHHHFAGLRSSGLVAPLVLDGPMRGEAYVGQFLAPDRKKGYVVVLDNLRAHKVGGVREAIRGPGQACSTRQI
jgi:hypothetical protein